MTDWLIRGGRIVDPASGVDRVGDLWIVDGAVTFEPQSGGGAFETFDAHGKIVAPGFVDLHTQLREPGFEEDETIDVACAAALAGGFTSLAVLPETDPPIDTPAGVEYVRQKAARARSANVYVTACVSKDRQGKELAEIGTLVEAGAVAFSDGVHPIGNPDLMHRALEYCRMFDRPILSHPETPELTRGGIMHEGRTSLALGLAGMPVECEEVAVARDLRLAEATGGKLHLLNLSAAGSVDLVRRAKRRGVAVSAGVCVANLVLSDRSLRLFDTAYKVNPPLRSQEHIVACQTGLADGTIDVISTGHAPRAAEKKMLELDQAPFGMIGLETTLSLAVEYLIEPGTLEWPAAIAALASNPARILGIPKGTLASGADGDVIVVDPAARWTLTRESLLSRSANTPFLGKEMRGRVEAVFVRGERKR